MRRSLIGQLGFATRTSALLFTIVTFGISQSAMALTIDGTAADKNTFLSYLINQGGAGNANSFAYLANGNANGPSILIANQNLAANFFGTEMAVASGFDNNNQPLYNLIVHVGQQVPRVFFGAFEFPAAGEQTIDLADILKLPIRSNNNLLGGTDVILHEVYEGLAGLGGGGFNAAHTINGIQEENSNRSADGNRGQRVVNDPMRPDNFVINNATGVFRFTTAWDITNANPALTQHGLLRINGKLTGGNNYNVTDVQKGYGELGGDTLTMYDVDIDSVEFVPEPSTCVLFALGAIGALAIRRRSRRAAA